MPPSVLAHVRYPEDLFKVQRQAFAKYHVTDSDGFYSGQDFWTIPNDPTTHSATSSAQPPYYLQVQGPGQAAPTFSLTTTFAPQKRTTLAAFMAVNSEPGPDYGKIRVLQLPTTTTIPGPVQMQNNFETDPIASPQLTLLRGSGSTVEYGNLLSLPVAGGVLYVEPVYVRGATADGFPLLKKVLASFGTKVAFKDTLAEALTSVLGSAVSGSTGTVPDGTGVTPPSTSPTPTPTPSTSGSLTAQQRLVVAIAAAQTAYDEGRAALARNDFAAYGVAQNKLAAALAAADAAQKELGFPTTSPTATPSPTPSPASSGTAA
jgi:uncharacterized membrane protein (UPF0182 family)